jgi:hypothetical protein
MIDTAAALPFFPKNVVRLLDRFAEPETLELTTAAQFVCWLFNNFLRSRPASAFMTKRYRQIQRNFFVPFRERVFFHKTFNELLYLFPVLTNYYSH